MPRRRFLQDGGLGGHNNPTLLCLLERRRLLSFHVSGYVLSLGTGLRTSEAESRLSTDHSSEILQWFHNHAAFRIGRSLGRLITGDQLASRLSQVEVARFNVELTGPLRISDTAGMETMRKTAQAELAKSSWIVEETVNALIERFYFVLDRPPKREGGQFHCEGSIRCRGNSRSIIPDLLRLNDARMEFVTDAEVLGELSASKIDLDTCPVCKRYRKKVIFLTDSLTNLMNIYLRRGRENKRRISAFPHSIEWFIRRQYLGACFGSVDHGSPGRLMCCNITNEGHVLQNIPATGLRKRKNTNSPARRSKRLRSQL